jgi:hypothetical protein
MTFEGEDDEEEYYSGEYDGSSSKDWTPARAEAATAHWQQLPCWFLVRFLHTSFLLCSLLLNLSPSYIVFCLFLCFVMKVDDDDEGVAVFGKDRGNREFVGWPYSAMDIEERKTRYCSYVMVIYIWMKW